ncbi:MAG: 30S ribosomal protein S8 [Candidatus Pacebacteria bacterium]|nr:30S ribosomal protein S8 [Candidatus Paceibacterota bacterium]
MYTDPLADMLNRIRTAQAVRKEAVNVPFSSVKYETARCLQKAGFVEKVLKGKRVKKPLFRIVLGYQEDGRPKINEIKRVSSPGQRIYQKSSEIKKIKNGLGLSVISTPKGVMTSEDARKNKLGGEVICEVW